MGAVSIRLMPRSIALKQVAIAASAATAPHSEPPIAQVPRPTRETSTPATFVVSMQKHLNRAGMHIAADSNTFIQASGEIKLLPVSCFPVLIDSNSTSGLRRVALHALLGTSIFASFASLSAAATAQTTAQTTVQAAPPDSTAASPPVVITLDEALKRAQSSESTYASAIADSKVAGLDRAIARAGLLPSVTYHNQALYTQPNG